MLATLGYWLADLAVMMMPARAADALAVRLARLWFRLRPQARRTLEANLGRLVPGVSPRELRARTLGAFEHFALSFVDFLRLARLDVRALESAIEVRGAHHLQAARDAGRGVILLSVHLGNWEWGAAYLAAHGQRIHLLARPHASWFVETLFRRRREQRGVGVLAGAPHWPRVASALRRGEWVALMGDRPARGMRPGARAAAGVPVCAWAAALARRTGAVVVPAVMVRLAPGRYAACFEPPLAAERVTGGGRAALRGFLMRYPGQWFGFEPLPESLG
ncbi:MAG TPA: hypothetical protein VEY91_05200 [Candidatus Limnocylindria bacterium]|nr:hypothetical protein [Candidatus Limnocylindria bacterium]